MGGLDVEVVGCWSRLIKNDEIYHCNYVMRLDKDHSWGRASIFRD